MGKIFELICENSEKYYGNPLGIILRDGYAFTSLLEKEIVDLVTDCNFPYDVNLQQRNFETEGEQDAFQKGYMRHFAIVQQNILDLRRADDKEKSFKEHINSLNEHELLALLKKFNLIYPLELETIDKLLKDIKPIKLTWETKERFLKTMRDTMRRRKKEKIK